MCYFFKNFSYLKEAYVLSFSVFVFIINKKLSKYSPGSSVTGKSSAQVIPGDDPQHAGMKLDDCLATGVLFLRNSDQDDPRTASVM